RGDHAQEFRHHDERRAARSAGTVSGGAQMSPSLPPALRRYAEHPFWQAVGILVLAYIVVAWVVPVLPGSDIVPKGVVWQYKVTCRGKTITLTGLENPLRQHPDSLPAYLTEGKHVYYRNCLPCHGDHLDGQGHFASGFNPLPANFQDNGTIAQLTESFVFWRV